MAEARRPNGDGGSRVSSAYGASTSAAASAISAAAIAAASGGVALLYHRRLRLRRRARRLRLGLGHAKTDAAASGAAAGGATPCPPRAARERPRATWSVGGRSAAGILGICAAVVARVGRRYEGTSPLDVVAAAAAAAIAGAYSSKREGAVDSG